VVTSPSAPAIFDHFSHLPPLQIWLYAFGCVSPNWILLGAIAWALANTKEAMRKTVAMVAVVLQSAVSAYAQSPGSSSAPSSLQESSSPEKTSTGHVSYIFGYKRLENRWAPGENQIDLGIADFDYRRTRWPLSLAGELSLSYTSQKPTLPGFKGNFAGTYEFNIGARKVWERWSRTQPFLGGGVSVLGGSTTTHVSGTIYAQEGHNARPGEWGEAGLYWLVGRHWHTGFRVEYSYGTITLFSESLNAGGVHVMALLGRRW